MDMGSAVAFRGQRPFITAGLDGARHVWDILTVHSQLYVEHFEAWKCAPLALRSQSLQNQKQRDCKMGALSAL